MKLSGQSKNTLLGLLMKGNRISAREVKGQESIYIRTGERAFGGL